MNILLIRNVLFILSIIRLVVLLKFFLATKFCLKKIYFNEINLKIILMYEWYPVPPQATHIQSLASATIILHHVKLKNNAIESVIQGSSLISLKL